MATVKYLLIVAALYFLRQLDLTCSETWQTTNPTSRPGSSDWWFYHTHLYFIIKW